MGTLQLDNSVAKQWITALRSGQYIQGKGNLYNPDNCSYCCLGVLGECLGLKKEQVANVCYLSALLERDSNPHNFLQTPFDTYFNVQDYLATINDKGTSFEEIADWLEQNLMWDE